MHAPAQLKSLVDELALDRLRWFPEIGVGFYPISNPAPYDESYFEKYVGYSETDQGKAITAFRIDFVNRHIGAEGVILDTGIGSGDFIATRDRIPGPKRRTYGFDINPRAVAWLRAYARFVDPNRSIVPALSMWDVLEHIEDFRPLLANVFEWLFVSIPIFDDCDHVLRSRHYRKDEHFWYFTHEGFIRIMGACGFKVIESAATECDLGRDSIFSYALKRER